MNDHDYMPGRNLRYECRRCGIDPVWPEAEEPCPYRDSPLPVVVKAKRYSWLKRVLAWLNHR